jgi:hypothetical protein
LSFQKLHGPSIKGNERVSAKPTSFVGYGAISEIAAGIQYREPGFCSRPVHHNIPAVDQLSDRFRNISGLDSVTT